MTDLFNDSSFWVLIAFIIFIILVSVKAKSKINDILEGRASLIKNKILESEKALQEAQNLLKESQLALKNYKNNSKNIISSEKQKALAKSKNYLNKISDDIKRKEMLLDKEIDYLQHNVKASIKRQIIEITINSVQNLISNTKNVQASEMIFKEFLKRIPGTISNSSYKNINPH